MAKRSLVPAVVVLAGVGVAIGALLWTSERDGPGSAELAAAQNRAPVLTGSATSDNARAAGEQIAATPVGGAADCAATKTMPGGANVYVANAPMVADLGKGFVVSGVARVAGSCEPARNARIQIWLNTERGGEGLASNRGSVMTDDQGRYRLETSKVVPQFGQPHVHIAYDDQLFRPMFLRPVLKSEHDASITVDFALAPNTPAS